MNEENYSSVEPAGDGDMDTTPPNPAVSAPPPQQGNWEMPKPVFRKSSGRLPQPFVAPSAPVAEESPTSETGDVVSASAPEDENISDIPPAADEAIVEPQPQISEEITLESDNSQLTAANRERSPVVRSILIVAVLLVIAGFIALFLSVVYFLFLAPAAETAF